ncbi:MAG: molybdenum cofactor guanylyltransferase [Dehalococcoidia bacterium]|nr:molybdenum cofactor guanylyltransferase [Chloroflexota bacterium]MCK4222039.1 molybdenum cofactor guanylyltransferase [Dehalococcoidia bacterium]MCK4262596.1 molybdenum cofactor guanylyltransferase [Dehalococcoidia bacterium]MCK4579774.1 molybdenum cofactor guanylyltransferase [Dehalococcoidia bacterium]
MTGIILAGGRSSRFGLDKVRATINGKSLIQWAIDCLAPLSTEIIIVIGLEDFFAAPSTKIQVIRDVYPGKGPLGGLYSGLLGSSFPRAIVIGCDMPFVSVALLDYMTRMPSVFDVVVPRTGKGVEPLCAIYSRSCVAAIHKLLERNELRIGELFGTVKVRYVEENEIDGLDPEHLSFFNVNTLAQLREARKLAGES